jgi:hypothetical protein
MRWSYETVARVCLATIFGIATFGCGQSSSNTTPSIRSESSWFVSDVSAEQYKCVAVGDGKHAWAWEPKTKGVYVVERSGRIINHDEPMLADVEPSEIIPCGDGQHAFVLSSKEYGDTSPLFRIGVQLQDVVEEPRLPRMCEARNAKAVSGGVWVSCARMDKNERKLVFLSSNTSQSHGPWEDVPWNVGGTDIGGVQLDDDRFVMAHDTTFREPPWAPPPPGSPEPTPPPPPKTTRTYFTVLDRNTGPATFDIKMPLRPQRSPMVIVQILPVGDKHRVWVTPFVGLGACLFDVNEAFRKNEQYSAPILFREARVFVRPASPAFTWAFIDPDSTWKDRTPKGAFRVATSEDDEETREANIPPLRIEEILPLDSTKALVQACDSDWKIHIYLTTEKGEFRSITEGPVLRRHAIDLGIDSPVYGPEREFLWKVYRSNNGSHFLLSSPLQGLLLFDSQTDRLTTIAGANEAQQFKSDVKEDNNWLWLSISDPTSHTRGLTVYDLSTDTWINELSPLLSKSPSALDCFPLGNGKDAFISGLGIGTKLVESDHSDLPIVVLLGTSKFSFTKALNKIGGDVPFDPNSEHTDIGISLENWFRPISGPLGKVYVEISDATKNNRVVFETPELIQKNRESWNLACTERTGRIAFDEPCQIRMSFKDDFGSNVGWVWSGIQFKDPQPLFYKSWFQLLAIFFGLIIVALLSKVVLQFVRSVKHQRLPTTRADSKTKNNQPVIVDPGVRDFFVSYTKADEAWAEWIAWTLEEAGLSVIIQAWDFGPASNFVLNMHQAASEATKTIAVLSSAYLEAAYTKPEWAAALVQDPEGKQRKLVPVRIAECKPTGLLAAIIYVDLVGLPEDDARAALLGAFLQRTKPISKPGFPGTQESYVPSLQPAYPGPVDSRSISTAKILVNLIEGADQSRLLSVSQRLQLNRQLNAILPQQFNMMLFAVKPEPGLVPPMPTPQADRSTALLAWAEGPSGCGLATLQELLETILNETSID